MNSSVVKLLRQFESRGTFLSWSRYFRCTKRSKITVDWLVTRKFFNSFNTLNPVNSKHHCAEVLSAYSFLWSLGYHFNKFLNLYYEWRRMSITRRSALTRPRIEKMFLPFYAMENLNFGKLTDRGDEISSVSRKRKKKCIEIIVEHKV